MRSQKCSLKFSTAGVYSFGKLGVLGCSFWRERLAKLSILLIEIDAKVNPDSNIFPKRIFCIKLISNLQNLSLSQSCNMFDE